MNVARISESYELRDLKLSPDRLLLDPSNPRIVLETQDHVGFSVEELASPDVQEYILSVISKSEYHVADLITSIRTSGFVPGLHEIIVKRVGKNRKYLVLEGNRRLTAIKHLLSAKEKLGPTVLETLQTLPVKEFVYRRGGILSEEETIDIILGLIHIRGPLEWSPIEKAHYVYKSYKRALERHGGGRRFSYDVDCARAVAPFFNYSVKRVRKELIVYRVYEQLKQSGYAARPTHYTLIDLAVGNRTLKGDYFELDPETFHFSEVGLERFSNLCIGNESPIGNPRDFRAFAEIYYSGTPHEVNLVETGEEPVQDVLRRVTNRLEKQQFLLELQDIKDRLGGLTISEFCETSGEINLIADIQRMVEERLIPLAGAVDGQGRSERSRPVGIEPVRGGQRAGAGRRRRLRPMNVQEALSLGSEDLATEIKRVLGKRPNNSCVRMRLPTYLLKEWEIVTRGRPRERFCRLVERVVGEMIRVGRVRAYKAKNERVRLES